MKPYIEVDNIRTFTTNISPESLVWHRDHEDRIVNVLEGIGWSFQYDNQLPFLIHPGDSFEIPKESYHRLLKGDSTLKVEILSSTIEQHQPIA